MRTVYEFSARDVAEEEDDYQYVTENTKSFALGDGHTYDDILVNFFDFLKGIGYCFTPEVVGLAPVTRSGTAFELNKWATSTQDKPISNETMNKILNDIYREAMEGR